jgi:PAS domain S-box-containing protein
VRAGDSADPLLAGLRHAGAAPLLALPLVADDGVVGVWTVALATAPAGDDAPPALAALAALAAGNLAAAHALDGERRRRRRLERVRTSALALPVDGELAELLRQVAEQARALVDAELASAAARGEGGAFVPCISVGTDGSDRSSDGEDEHFLCDPGASDEGDGDRESRDKRGKRDIRDNREQRGKRESREKRDSRDNRDSRDGASDGDGEDATARPESFLAVSLRREARVVGSLYVANKRGGRAFSGDDRAAIELWAEHAAVAVDQACARAVAAGRVEHDRGVEVLRGSAESLRRLMENAPDIIYRCRLRPRFVIEYLSSAVAQLLGRAPQEFYDDPSLAMEQVHPLDRAVVEAALRAPERFHGPLVFRCLRADGGVAWIESQWATVVEDGCAVAVEGVARDVTARKHAESQIEQLLERVRAERTRLQTVIDSSPVGLLLVEDAQGRRVSANRAVEALFGRRFVPGAGMAQHLDQLRDDKGWPLDADELLPRRALAGETVVGVERICVQPDGREVPLWVSAVPLRDRGGEVSGALVVYEDISTMKQLEQLREEWTSIVAHDLRQPIAIVGLQAHALARSVAPDDSVGQERLEHIHAAVAQINRMIADLLDVSRLETKHLELNRRDVAPAMLVAGIAGRLREAVAPHRLDVAIEPELPRLRVDPDRIEQALTNLISNAAKYAYAQSRVTVAAARRERELVLSVTNLGPGIAAADLPRLFQRFRRCDAPREVAGLGLGLYIAKGIVEAHGGRIWAESVPGGETTFSFALPLG